MSKMKHLRGKLVLVTGGGAGIGRSIALAFGKRGASVVLTDIDAVGLAAVKAEVEALGVRCGTYVADVSDRAAVQQLADTVEEEIGVPDVLVNNAGIGFLGDFFKSTLDHWPRVMNINVLGAVYNSYYFVPKMLAAGGRRSVVVVASGASVVPPPNAAAYGASKAAVFSFAESLKMDLSASQIVVTTVCPGITNTGIVKKPADPGAPAVSDEQRRKMQEYYVKRGATPEAVAESIVKGVENGTNLVLVGPASRLLYNLRRISLPMTRRLNYAAAKSAGFR